MMATLKESILFYLPQAYFYQDIAACENVEVVRIALTAGISSTILGHLLSCK